MSRRKRLIVNKRTTATSHNGRHDENTTATHRSIRDRGASKSQSRANIVSQETRNDDDEEEEDAISQVIPISAIRSQRQDSDSDYLRLRALSGSLPLGFFAHESFQGLRILNLRGCKLKSLPPQIIQLSKLRYLDISDIPRIELPCQLSRLNIQRILFSSDLLDVAENFWQPYEPFLGKNYCGDSTSERISKLSRMAAKALIDACSLPELDEVRESLPAHLSDYVVPSICSECGSIGRKIVASRVRNAVVAFQSLPLHFPVCSVACLELLQASWTLEDALNKEKRLLRQQKFGGLVERQYIPYAII